MDCFHCQWFSWHILAHYYCLSLTPCSSRRYEFLAEKSAMTRKGHKAEGREMRSEERLYDEWIFWSQQKGAEHYGMETRKMRYRQEWELIHEST